jgi:3-oxoacyl-[acyl-carrier protein] reductase
MSWNVELDGETAIVTGGSRNIGLATAVALRSAGARVCIVGLSDAEALAAAVEKIDPEGRDVMGELVDVSDEAAVVDLFERAHQRLGPVSILVNGAATRPHEPFTELSRESWSRTIDVILTGAFLTSRELFRRLPEDRKGAIVNLGGLSAHRPAKDRAHVIAAKSGLIGLTRALAEEGLGRIRANAVVPGLIATERRPGQSNPRRDEKDRTRPEGTSRDVARAVLAFSDPSDVYVTGQTVHVNGGRYMP